MYEIYETKERITADNDKEAEKSRAYLKEKNVFLINLMGSPGCGKTTTLVRTINALKDQYRIGVMEADVDSDVDAETIHQLGVKVIQLHSGGLCHMDADMTARGYMRMGIDDLDVVILENIGNLVSVPEGDDKPLKYPLMFQVSDCLLINKIDTKAIFDFNEYLCAEWVHKLNPDMEIFALSSKTGEGFDVWIEWLKQEIEEWRKA